MIYRQALFKIPYPNIGGSVLQRFADELQASIVRCNVQRCETIEAIHFIEAPTSCKRILQVRNVIVSGCNKQVVTFSFRRVDFHYS